MNRRSFLKSSAAVNALAGKFPHDAKAANGLVSSTLEGRAAGEQAELPSIPRCVDLASDRLVYDYSDMFTPPPAQNEAGFCQTTKSISGISAILFPPYSCCGKPRIPTPGGDISPGNLITCELFLNGRMLASYPRSQARLAITWSPHYVLRETVTQGIEFITKTFMPDGQRAAAELIAVKNISHERRELTLGFDLRAGVSYKEGPWYLGDPAETDNRLTSNVSSGFIAFESVHSRAISVQGISPPPQRIEQGRVMTYDLTLDPGEERIFQYVNVMGGERSEVLIAYGKLQGRLPDALKESEQAWDSRIGAAFTPGNSVFSGSLPRLVTRDRSLWKLYYAGFLDLLLSRRVTKASVYGTTYVTCARGTATLSYIWDTMLTSLSLALLDPLALRSLLETWLAAGMDRHYATDYLSGKGMGVWYAPNDLGILRCADDYLRVTGDYRWLDNLINGKIVLDLLQDHALRWKTLDKFGHGLADYGGMESLLECVSTYVHEVAGVNAGNVYGMRFVASLLDRRGGSARAAQLRKEAKDLAERINRLLYVDGKGWWKSGQCDGTFLETRHCLDLLSVLDTMLEDLSETQRKEMANFFWSELHTPLWMHALSPGDADASWNPGAFAGLRSDHTWIGAYLAWPSMMARGLYKIDSSSRVTEWLKNVALTANQGTFGQAHFVDTTIPPDAGGARKDPVGSWNEVAGGNFMNLVIDSIFGAQLTMDKGVSVQSRLQDFDPEARLEGLNYQGQHFTISASGAHKEPSSA